MNLANEIEVFFSGVVVDRADGGHDDAAVLALGFGFTRVPKKLKVETGLSGKQNKENTLSLSIVQQQCHWSLSFYGLQH